MSNQNISQRVKKHLDGLHSWQDGQIDAYLQQRRDELGSEEYQEFVRLERGKTDRNVWGNGPLMGFVNRIAFSAEPVDQQVVKGDGGWPTTFNSDMWKVSSRSARNIGSRSTTPCSSVTNPFAEQGVTEEALPLTAEDTAEETARVNVPKTAKDSAQNLAKPASATENTAASGDVPSPIASVVPEGNIGGTGKEPAQNGVPAQKSRAFDPRAQAFSPNVVPLRDNLETALVGDGQPSTDGDSPYAPEADGLHSHNHARRYRYIEMWLNIHDSQTEEDIVTFGCLKSCCINSHPLDGRCCCRRCGQTFNCGAGLGRMYLEHWEETQSEERMLNDSEEDIVADRFFAMYEDWRTGLGSDR